MDRRQERKYLKCLVNTAEKTVEQAAELEEKKKPLAGLSYKKKTIEWLVRQKSRIEKQVIMIVGIISKANKLEIELEESLHLVKDEMRE
uniref:Uncharacterized protein n=1 Tax=Onchocerca volvulus TaxID=6282 RepID=A0A044SCK0_ONCVO